MDFLESVTIPLLIVAGFLYWCATSKITRPSFDEVLSSCSASVATAQPGVPVVFVSDNGSIHQRALGEQLHTSRQIRFLPSNSPDLTRCKNLVNSNTQAFHHFHFPDVLVN